MKSGSEPTGDLTTWLLQTLGRWTGTGGSVHWEHVFPGGGRRVPLPVTRFQRQNFLIPPPQAPDTDREESTSPTPTGDLPPLIAKLIGITPRARIEVITAEVLAGFRERTEEPGQPRDWYNLGAGLLLSGDWEGALEPTQRALDTDDEGLERAATYNLALARALAGRPPELSVWPRAASVLESTSKVARRKKSRPASIGISSNLLCAARSPSAFCFLMHSVAAPASSVSKPSEIASSSSGLQ